MKKKLIRDLMMADIKAIDQSKSVQDAAKIMAKNNIGALVCKDKEGNTVGIFTERDVLKKVVAKGASVNEPVSNFMTKDLITAQLHDDVDKIPEMMLKGSFRHVPIMDGFELVGILSIKDIVRYLIAKK